jgi:hypothetical protein
VVPTVGGLLSCGQLCWDMVCRHVGGSVGRLLHIMWSFLLGYGLSSRRWYCWEVVSCGQFCWDMVCCHMVVLLGGCIMWSVLLGYGMLSHGGTVGRLYHVVSSVGIWFVVT